MFVLCSPLLAEKITIVASPIDEQQHGSISGNTPTAFTEVIQVNRSARGLIDTEGALRITSSIDLPDYGGGVTPPVSLRGSNFQQTLIMVDGVVISPVTGDLVDLSLYALPLVDRVEVIKGSTSSVYGKSAMGGVINIVTPRPTFRNNLDITSSQGTNGYSLTNAVINTHLREVGFLASLTRHVSENDFLYERDDGSTIRRENNHVLAYSTLTKAWFDLSGWDTMVTGTLIDQEKGSPGSEGSSGWLTPDDEVSTFRSSLSVDTRKAFDDETAVLLRASRYHDRVHAQTSYSGDTWTRLTTDSAGLSFTKLFGRVEFRPGLEILREKLSSVDYGNRSRSTTSALLGTWIDFEDVLFNLTVRRDMSSAFDPRWNVHAGALWRVSEFLDLRSNIGTGYREPTMGNLYAPSSWYVFIPNEDLKPETSLGWDVGPTLTFTHFGAGVSYFVTTYEDLIRMDFPAEMSFTYVNVDKARSSGIESYAWVKAHDLVKLSGNYSVNRFTYANGPFKSNYLKHKPPRIASLIVDITPHLLHRPVDISLMYLFRQGVYVDQENSAKTRNRSILDAGFSAELSDDATVSFKVNNILNDTNREFEDFSEWGSFWYPVSGRTYRFTLQLAL
ncbi:MAG: TonB-dependent receptor [Desulfomonilia bacterium]|nr:TonB-dependent receptor [Desulfomonilia bacterium]